MAGKRLRDLVPLDITLQQQYDQNRNSNKGRSVSFTAASFEIEPGNDEEENQSRPFKVFKCEAPLPPCHHEMPANAITDAWQKASQQITENLQKNQSYD